MRTAKGDPASWRLRRQREKLEFLSGIARVGWMAKSNAAMDVAWLVSNMGARRCSRRRGWPRRRWGVGKAAVCWSRVIGQPTDANTPDTAIVYSTPAHHTRAYTAISCSPLSLFPMLNLGRRNFGVLR